ncbi:MAG: hypothetical protein HQ547_06350 [Candidatus Omnitrophica bacterium]|nr:hypothetical protein [Candidatus Omnitrophota bacterium]
MQKNKCCIVVLFVLVFFPAGIAYGQVLDGWITAKGHFCTLYIGEDVDIKQLNRRIDTYRVDFGLSERPLRLTSAPESEILYKFDLVFLKVQELLDMRPGDIHVDVRIYRRKKELDKLYVEIFSERGDLVAFYVFKLNTIFACEEKISVAVVAHEVAHCIIDHHFTVAPPKKIAEMIAHYAERHLRG